jgi:hypothetical protein
MERRTASEATGSLSRPLASEVIEVPAPIRLRGAGSEKSVQAGTVVGTKVLSDNGQR